MANNKAFVFPIGNQTEDQYNFNYEKQTSPSWVLSFIRFYYRDLFRTSGEVPTKVPVDDPLIVQSDCIDVEVSTVKNNLTPSIKMTLVQTDTDYETAVVPGDFVLVNMLNWDTSPSQNKNNNQNPNNNNSSFIYTEMGADDIVERIKNKQNINRLQDGFKGVFRIQSVRKTVSVDPGTGIKSVIFEIIGFAFTEFNNALYFNQNLINQQVQGNLGLYLADISKQWASLNCFSGVPYIQELIAALIQIFLGAGSESSITGNNILNTRFSFNQQYLVPGLVGQLLGLTNTTSSGGAISAKNIYLFIFGIQTYQPQAATDLGSGMTPFGLSEKYPNFFYTGDFCSGNSTLKADYWNNVKLWSVLNQYTNSPLNELYTCFRLFKDGNVYPTMVFRQIPFTNDDFITRKFGTPADDIASTIPTTQFMTVPRWKIAPYYIFSQNIGREESARINFVQYFAKCTFSKTGIDYSGETAKHNYCFDSDDALRSGLKPLVVSNEFSNLSNQAIDFSPVWARIIADSLFGGQLKLNGTLECIGIYEPIAVGDNLEFDGVVYHIEGIIHRCNISKNGVKSFRTIITLSMGLSVTTTDTAMQYADMTNSNAYLERAADYTYNKILPGVSESQDTVDRNGNIDKEPTANLPFPQPNKNKG